MANGDYRLFDEWFEKWYDEMDYYHRRAMEEEDYMYDRHMEIKDAFYRKFMGINQLTDIRPLRMVFNEKEEMVYFYKDEEEIATMPQDTYAELDANDIAKYLNHIGEKDE